MTKYMHRDAMGNETTIRVTDTGRVVATNQHGIVMSPGSYYAGKPMAYAKERAAVVQAARTGLNALNAVTRRTFTVGVAR